MQEFSYTITTSDHNNYASIHSNLRGPLTELTEFMVTKITTTCSFVILDQTDYIEMVYWVDAMSPFQIVKIYWPSITINLNYELFKDTMSNMLGDKYYFENDPLGLPTLMSNQYYFGIKSMSYRMKLVMGMYHVEFRERHVQRVRATKDRIGTKITKDDYIQINGVVYLAPYEEVLNAAEVDGILKLMRDTVSAVDNSWVFVMKIHNKLGLYHEGGERFVVNRMSPGFEQITGIEYPAYSESANTFSVISKYSTIIKGEPNRFNRDIVLDVMDFIMIGTNFDGNNKPLKTIPYHIKKMFSISKNDDLTLLDILRETFEGKYRFWIDSNNQINMTNAVETYKEEIHFKIIYITNELREATGFKSDSYSEPHYYIRSPSVSFYQLTPILYLTSNLGTTHHSYTDNDCINQKILMKIDNYFVHGFPVISNNFEFASIVSSSALSEAWFQLVDANFMPVKLLSPMHISAVATGINKKDGNIYLKDD